MMLKLHIVVTAVCSTLLLAGCGKGEERKPASQVAAKVNGTEISVHQINNAMVRLGGAAAADPKAASRQVLESLIDQQVVIQQATQSKLDRDAAVVTAIENARRQILSQAYLERATSETAKPTAEDVKKYYAEHPYLFEQRRIYRFAEVAVNATDEKQMADLKTEMGRTRSLPDVLAWIKSSGMAFRSYNTIKPVEQMPAGLVPRVQKMKAGDVMFFPAGNRALIMQLTSSQEMPLTEAEAKPYIEQVLWSQKRAESAAGELKKLRAQAKVEYVGDFAVAQAAPSQAPQAQAASAESSHASLADQGATKAAPAAKSPVADAGTTDTNLMDKGLTGLK
jgi:EpsD family peptidyl-prolyl cis-trans isomerase